MNGRKPKNSLVGDSGKPKQSGGLVWVDARLTDEDYSALESDGTTLDVLSAMLIKLVVDGYGVSVKYNFERKCYTCTIYRSPTHDNSRNLGLSSSAPDLRDTILATLYRLEVKCGGVLDDGTPANTPNQQSRRFG